MTFLEIAQSTLKEKKKPLTSTEFGILLLKKVNIKN